MKFFLACLILLLIASSHESGAPSTLAQAVNPAAQAESVTGRWQVKFNISSIGEKNLVLDSRTRGHASILLLDTGPDNKPVTDPLPATTSITTNGRVNFSGEVELPFGTCCRQVGTLIFKGKFGSNNSISGTAIFVGSDVDEENPLGFRSMLGSFTATRIRDDK
jgi:hypothetical protein